MYEIYEGKETDITERELNITTIFISRAEIIKK